MASFEKGANVWYHHPQETWIPTTVSIGGSGELTVKTEDGEVRAEPPLLPQCPLGRALCSRLLTPARCAPPLQELTVEAGSGNVMPLHPSSLTACEDMVSLGDMNNAALLHNLRLRYWEDDIFVSPAAADCPPAPCAPRDAAPAVPNHFAHRRGTCQTYIGPILIAVNPYKPIPIFSPGYVDKYFNRAASDVSAPAPQHAASPSALLASAPLRIFVPDRRPRAREFRNYRRTCTSSRTTRTKT